MKKKQNHKSSRPSSKAKQKKQKSLLGTFETKILSILKKDRENDFSSRNLMKKSGIKDKEVFYNALHKLEELGQINVDKKHRVSLNNLTETVGTVVSLSKGFAFVSCEDGSDDVFVPGRHLNKAFLGDKVLLTNIEKDDKGRIGTVSKITQSAKEMTTGTVVKEGFGFALAPDGAIRYNPVLLNPEIANVGDKVYAKIVQDNWGDWTRAEIIKVFGSGESAKVCSDAILQQYDISLEFPKAVLDEAKEISKMKITKTDYKSRLDLRDEDVFTIDGADAKDLDDAISIKKFDDHWELGVHIADVSHYIKSHSQLDKEAFARGTSVYFADRVVPMLPKEISNGVCSLNCGQDKLCLSAIITLDLNGIIKKYKFHKTVIHSKVRGVYCEVNEIFAKTANKELLEKYAPVKKSLELSYELAEILKKNSKNRGTMEIDSGESKFVLDENGICVSIVPRESGEAQELIEQFMICANVCAAKYSMDKEIPFIYRVHENPEPQRIRALADLLQALGIPCKELLKEKPNTADFQRILEKSKGTTGETVVSQRLLRTMEKAKYSSEPLGHFGLALKDYSHFTSPIRRYPDTSIHRIISFILEKEEGDITKRFKAFTVNSAVQSSSCELKATRAERDAQDCYMAEYMGQHIGEHYTGKISGVTKNGVFVRLESTVEGFVPIDNFKNNYFIFDGIINHRCANTGRVLTIGTELNIIVASSNVATGKVDFTVNE